MLEHAAEQCVDRPFVGALDVEMVRDRAVLLDTRGALGEQKPGGLAERGAPGFHLFERPEPRFVAGQRPLAQRERLRTFRVLRALRGQRRFDVLTVPGRLVTRLARAVPSACAA